MRGQGLVKHTALAQAFKSRRTVISFVLVSISLFLPFAGCGVKQTKSITAYVGSASKPPMDEAAQVFESQVGVKVYLNYGGSGTMLSQMKLSKSGDVYIPGSSDFMAAAVRDNLIRPQSEQIVAYLIPVIAVQTGNPKNIRSLSDLAKPGIKVAIGNPEAVCLGLYAVELLQCNGLLSDVSKNIVTYAESCEKLATLLSLKAVDAVIGWDVFGKWSPESIEVIYLRPEQLPRIGYIPAAVSTYSTNVESAQKFTDFLVSKTAQDIFRKWGYIVTEDEAKKYAPKAEIGGEVKINPSYNVAPH